MNTDMKHVLFLCILLGLCPIAPGQTNWPAFRGADGLGVADNAALPEHWSATKNVRWKRDVAHAVSGDHTHVTNADESSSI